MNVEFGEHELEIGEEVGIRYTIVTGPHRRETKYLEAEVVGLKREGQLFLRYGLSRKEVYVAPNGDVLGPVDRVGAGAELLVDDGGDEA